MAELPAYRIRESRRARRVSLSLCPIRGLEVVVPAGYDRARLPSLIAGYSDWLQRADRRLQRLRAEFPPGHCDAVPGVLDLRALDEQWPVDRVGGTGGGARVRERAGRLLVTNGESAARASLRAWLKRRARARLVPWLEGVSRRTGLGYARTAIRGQRTRWASCSSRGTISLNYKILFLPPPLVDYLLVHELAHTRHMNHSERFWRLVERHCPEYRARERELAGAWRFVPVWNEMD